MKHIPLLLVLSLFIGCNTATKKEVTSTIESKSETVEEELNTKVLGDYTSLFTAYQCDIGIEEISKILNVPIADLEMPSHLNNSKNCGLRYSRSGTYESNLTWGIVKATKEGNKKAIAKALKDREENVSVLGSDIIIAETGDCYLLRTPINGRITIRNANYENAFQLFYGSKSRRSKEQHDELKVKMTKLANYLLKKYRK